MNWGKIKNALWTIISIPASIILYILISGAWIAFIPSCEHKSEEGFKEDITTKEPKQNPVVHKLDSVDIIRMKHEEDSIDKEWAFGFIVDGDSEVHTSIHFDLPINGGLKLISYYEYYNGDYKTCLECDKRDKIFLVADEYSLDEEEIEKMALDRW